MGKVVFYRPPSVLVDHLKLRQRHSKDRLPIVLDLDALSASALGHLLRTNPTYLRAFLSHWERSKCRLVAVRIDWFKTKLPVGLRSYALVSRVLWHAVELEDALHWLSTLGGAYSNLGEHSKDFALKAGSNALIQLRVVVRSFLPVEPFLLLRSWLFVAMSQVQVGHLGHAASIIRAVHLANSRYDESGRRSALDDKLDNMCRGIWSRLRHARIVRRRKAKKRAQ